MPVDPPSYEPQGPRRSRPDGGSARPVGKNRPLRNPQPQPDPPSYAPGGGHSADSPAALPPEYPVPSRAPHQPPTAEPPPQPLPPPERPRPPKRRKSAARGVITFLLILLLAWPIGLGLWANSQLTHVSALSGATSTSGTTYLLAGSDSRADLAEGDPGFDKTAGARTDTILLLHVPDSGTSSLISLPRDSYVAIPGHENSKLNAAYSWGGPPLLVETVENLSGFTVDHYVEIGFAGITNIVDELNGVELCYDEDVSDWRSDLEWEAGCHEADGTTALAFARMRYADKEGDIGRTDRQRQLIAAITDEAATIPTVLNPVRQVGLVNAGTNSLVVDEDTGIFGLGRLALAFRKATGPDGWSGAPPIASTNYRPGGVGSAVQLDEAQLPQFFEAVAAGNPPETD